MREIAEHVKWIDDEIEGCEQYAEAAIKAKENGDMESSRVYCEMANQECAHAEKLHALIVSKINETKRNGVEVPKGMMDVWEWKHGEYVKRMAEAKAMLQMCQQ